jgi:thiosulfate dehydrogenase [quinone] large subunit
MGTAISRPESEVPDRDRGIDDQEDTMTTTGSHAQRPVLRSDDAFLAEPVHEETPRHTAYRYTLALIRISMGWVFLWAFIDKMFALGFHTGYNQDGVLDRFGDAAWIHGGSPTEGFLAFGATGPFKGFYNDIAGAGWADWLFMLGLLGIGTALILGIGMRFAAAAGSLLLVMMWSVVLAPENNPFMDDHLIYAMVLVLLALTSAGRTFGLGRVWEKVPLVQKYGWLK